MIRKLALFLALSLLLAACGDPTSSGAPPGGTPPLPGSQSESQASSEAPDEELPPPEIETSVWTWESEPVKAADIKKLSCKSATPTAVMNNGDVLLWGSNVFRGVGNGEEGDTEPRPPIRHHFRERILDAEVLVNGYALTESGEVYLWGENWIGETGMGNDPIPVPQKVALDFRVKQVSLSTAFVLYLSDTGEVYQTGIDISKYRSAREYEFSLTEEVEHDTSLKKLDLPFRCAQIDSSATAYVFLSEEGEVYFQGLIIGDYSRTSENFCSETAEKVDFPEKITDVSVTGFHIVALSETGRVYVFGRPLSGVSDSKVDEAVAENLYRKKLTGIVSVDSGEFVVSAVSEDGRMYCWGLDKRGIIDSKNNTGSPPTGFELIPEPRDMGLSGVVSGGVGGYNGTAKCADGSVHIWGGNTIGQIIAFE